MVNDQVVTIPVEVIASRPIVRGGAVLHELQMRQVEEHR
jgi:hypothetical protein